MLFAYLVLVLLYETIGGTKQKMKRKHFANDRPSSVLRHSGYSARPANDDYQASDKTTYTSTFKLSTELRPQKLAQMINGPKLGIHKKKDANIAFSNDLKKPLDYDSSETFNYKTGNVKLPKDEYNKRRPRNIKYQKISHRLPIYTNDLVYFKKGRIRPDVYTHNHNNDIMYKDNLPYYWSIDENNEFNNPYYYLSKSNLENDRRHYIEYQHYLTDIKRRPFDTFYDSIDYKNRPYQKYPSYSSEENNIPFLKLYYLRDKNKSKNYSHTKENKRKFSSSEPYRHYDVEYIPSMTESLSFCTTIECYERELELWLSPKASKREQKTKKKINPYQYLRM